MRAGDKSRFIWCDADGVGRNVFAVFRLSLTLSAPPTAAALHLFADSRYRLRVNGAVAAYGPARFVPSAPEYDTIDLTRWLRPGDNTVTVEVNHYGTNNYQAMPDDRGGFVAWGSIRDEAGSCHDLSTPGVWQVWRSDAWDALAPPYSFAQPAVEILDTRRWDGISPPPDACWQSPVPCAQPGHWALPAPRSIPAALDVEQPAARIDLATALQAEHRLACRVTVSDFTRHRPSPACRRFAVAAFLHTSEARDVELGLFWGPFYLNGIELRGQSDPLRGNRVNYPARLATGWNLLYGEVEVLMDAWGMVLAVPPGVSARAEPRLDSTAGLRHTAAIPEGELHRSRPVPPATPQDLDAMAVVWRYVPLDALTGMPARECAWDLPAARFANPAFPCRLPASAPHAVVVDFGGEFLGHPIVDVEAPAGTVLDVVADEHKRADGLLSVFATNPFTDTADRFVLRGGPQRVEGFHVRGGRYLQLVFRPASGDEGYILLRCASVRSARTALAEAHAFGCSDPLLEWVWHTGRATLHACTEDAYLDCPWRERGLYAGDSFVIGRIQRLLTRDLSLVRRCLRLFAQGRLDSGLLPAVVPAWHRQPHGDFVLIWLLGVHAYWQWTRHGDFVRELWPVIEGLWRSPAWTHHASGLWNSDGVKPFVDWGIPPRCRHGDENAALNAFRAAALNACVDLAGVAAPERTAAIAAEAAATIDTFRKRLWNPGLGAYAPFTYDGLPAGEPGLHASILALAFGLEAPAHTAPLLAYVRTALRANVEAGIAGDRPQGHAELYFLSFALQALYRFDLARDAEELVRAHYGPMRDAGAWTLWECFSRGLKSIGSLCHAWSGGPMIHFVHDTVGIQPQPAGAEVDVLVAPCADTLDRAEATLPHPRGDLHVAWRVEGSDLRVRVEIPADLRWKLAPRGRLAALCLKLA